MSDTEVTQQNATEADAEVSKTDVAEAVREVLPTQQEASEVAAQPSLKVSPLALAAEGYPIPTEAEVAALFDHWNAALQTQDPEKVVALYADDAVLMPTLSGRFCADRAAKLEYFQGFCAKQPWGTVTERVIVRGHGVAIDSGHYTFHFKATGDEARARFTLSYGWDGRQWLITGHHSSLQPDLEAHASPSAPEEAASAQEQPENEQHQG